MLTAQLADGQDTAVVSRKMFKEFSNQLSLDKMDQWIFRSGNNSNWAQPLTDTVGWIKLKPLDLSKKYADKNGRVEGWFQIKIKFDTSLLHKEMWVGFASFAAMDLYLDGRLIAKRGNTGDSGEIFKEYNGNLDPPAILFNKDSVHLFSVHFVGYLSPFPPHDLKYQASGSLLVIVGPNPYTNIIKSRTVLMSFVVTWISVCAVLSVLFWLLSFQNPREKNLVWVALCTSLYTISIFFASKVNAIGIHYVPFYVYDKIANFCVFLLLFFGIPFLIAKLFNRAIGRKLVAVQVVLFLLVYSIFFFFSSSIIFTITGIIGTLSTLAICIYYIFSSWKQLKGAQWAIVVGLFFSLFSLLAGPIYSLIVGEMSFYFFFSYLSCFLLSFPLSLLVYVSIRFKEIIKEVGVNADRIVQLSEEKRAQAENQQKILQQEVSRQTAEIRHTLDNLKSTQSQLIQSEKMASLGELTAGIAHEIQNPLNFVNNFSEVNKEMIAEMKEEITKGNYDEVKIIADDIEANQEKINHHGKRAEAIVKSMLEHSRAGSGVKELTDINALCDEYLRLSYHGLRAKDKTFNAEMRTDFDHSIGKINIIPQDIGRVLLNLYNNAFYAVTEKKNQLVNKEKSGISDEYQPVVSVSTRRSDNSVIITVSDNGNGIPKNIVDKIFQPFFTTKPTGSGTGLGLSLSYDIVKAHGGAIKVETKENEGTEFIIELPNTAIS
jgi:signal transduction histidine kinase